MTEYKVSTRYALSILESASAKNLLDVVSKDVEFILSVFTQNANLVRVLENPTIKPEVKSRIISEIFQNKIDHESLEFLLFVIKKKREEILTSILDRFKELRDEQLGFVNVSVTVASEFSDTQKDELKSKLESLLEKKVRMNFSTDENLIGGFIFQAGDTVHNSSVKHRLNTLRRYLIEGNPLTN